MPGKSAAENGKGKRENAIGGGAEKPSDPDVYHIAGCQHDCLRYCEVKRALAYVHRCPFHGKTIKTVRLKPFLHAHAYFLALAGVE